MDALLRVSYNNNSPLFVGFGAFVDAPRDVLGGIEII